MKPKRSFVLQKDNGKNSVQKIFTRPAMIFVRCTHKIKIKSLAATHQDCFSLLFLQISGKNKIILQIFGFHFSFSAAAARFE